MNRFAIHPHRLVLPGVLLLLFLAAGWIVAPQFASGGGVTPTNTWVDIYSMGSFYNGQPIPVGAVVAVYDPQDVKCGEFVVHTTGMFGIMPCYGDDPLTSQDEGAEPGDALHFTIEGQFAEAVAISHNGMSVAPDTPVIWNQNGERWQINLVGPAPTPTPIPAWRFRGHTYRGLPGDANNPLAGVKLHLYGRSAGEPPPGNWIKTVVSDNSGFYNFYILEPWVYDIMQLVAEAPEGMVATGAESEDGTIISNTEIVWTQPEPIIHYAQFFFDIPTPTPTPTVTPTATPTSTPTATPTSARLFMPLILRLQN